MLLASRSVERREAKLTLNIGFRWRTSPRGMPPNEYPDLVANR
jgi:hypothetical protein